MTPVRNEENGEEKNTITHAACESYARTLMLNESKIEMDKNKAPNSTEYDASHWCKENPFQRLREISFHQLKEKERNDDDEK